MWGSELAGGEKEVVRKRTFIQRVNFVAVHTYVQLEGASERGARWLLQRLVAWVC